jgi:hypothetical protein
LKRFCCSSVAALKALVLTSPNFITPTLICRDHRLGDSHEGGELLLGDPRSFRILTIRSPMLSVTAVLPVLGKGHSPD